MIELSSKEIAFMLTNIPLPQHIKSIFYNSINDIKLIINEDIASELRELCIDRFDTYGLDINYEPTEEGKILERLIDKLFI